MNITGYDSREAAIGWANKVAVLLQQQSALSSAQEIELAIDQFRSANFQLAILGKAKRGKSTLINALLGRSDDTLAPIDKLPASSAITRFTWANKEQAIVRFRDGHAENIGVERIREFVTEEFNPDNQKSIDLVDVAGPFDDLDRDLVLIDTPGAGSIHQHHDALLHAFIPQADAVLFLVTARMPLDKDELELLAAIKSADISKVFLAINRIDELSTLDIDEAVDHNRQLLAQVGIQIDRIHKISAKRAFLGDRTGSGLAPLAADMAAFLAANKGRVLQERFVRRVAAQVAPVLYGLEVELAYSSKSQAELQSDLARLGERKRTIESERSLAEREFVRAWQTAVDLFEQAILATRSDVSTEFTKRVAETPLTQVNSLASQIPTRLQRAIEEKLALSAQAFERAARDACNRLKASYPEISLGDAGAIVVRTSEGQTFLAGSASGLAATAVGTGVVAAGGAAAAGIAATNAAALAMTTTIAAPSVLSGVLTLAGLEVLAPLATGAATVAAPGALVTTPFWVALAGPVGWTLAGVGLLAIPFSWRLSKLKLRDKLDEAVQDQIRTVFERLKSERLPALRQMGNSIIEEFRIRQDRELHKIESAMVSVRDRRPSDAQTEKVRQLVDELRLLLVDKSRLLQVSTPAAELAADSPILA